MVYQFMQEQKDLEVTGYISAQPLIKGLFTGHTHYYHESCLIGGTKQYVAGAHFEGDTLEIEVV
jgi:hypothetical protein